MHIDLLVIAGVSPVHGETGAHSAGDRAQPGRPLQR